MVLRKKLEVAVMSKEVALSSIYIGAIFFALRLCEYLNRTHKEDNKRTKILRLKNIILFKKERHYLLEYKSHNIRLADPVIITFKFQKNNKRKKTEHRFKIGDDILLCPVKSWTYTIQQITDTVPYRE